MRFRQVLARRLSREPGRDRRWPVRSSLSRSSSVFNKCWLLTVVAPRQPAGWLQCRVTVLFTVSDPDPEGQRWKFWPATVGLSIRAEMDRRHLPSPPSLMSFGSTTSNVAKCTLRDEGAALPKIVRMEGLSPPRWLVMERQPQWSCGMLGCSMNLATMAPPSPSIRGCRVVRGQSRTKEPLRACHT